MEEYLKLVLLQIRYRGIHSSVRAELEEHIREQAKDNELSGMNSENALKAAIHEMGDPVEVGVSLDRIHRPRMEWRLLALMLVITIVSVLIHVSVGINYIADSMTNYTVSGYITRIIVFETLGFAVMLLMYRIDYSVLAIHAKKLAGALLVIAFITVIMFGKSVNITNNYIYFAGISLDISSLMLLYIPIYGGILFQKRGSGIRGILECLLWMIMPVCLVLYMIKVPQALVCFLIMSVMLTIAVTKDWFKVTIKRFVCGYWGTLLIATLSIGIGILNGLGASVYQVDRVRSWFDGAYDDSNYIISCISELLQSSKWIGDSGIDIAGVLPCYNSNYILVFISVHFGKLAMIGVCLLLFILIYAVFRTIISQKNQLGFMVGIGCGLVLFVSTLFYFAEMMRILPLTSRYLFFFSYGGSQVIIGDLLIGIVLSIYRYKNLAPMKPKLDTQFFYKMKIARVKE